MTWAFAPLDLCDGEISIRRFCPNDFDRIAQAIFDPSGYFGTTHGIDSLQKTIALLAVHYEEHLLGRRNPLVFEVDGEIAGITGLFQFDTRRKSLEIGPSWLACKWRGTYLNTKTKLMVMRYAFETLEVERIEFVVAPHNYISQMAVQRIGAKLEGRMRSTMTSLDGIRHDGFLYSIIRSEWSCIEGRLQKLLIQEPVEDSWMRSIWETKRLTLKKYSLADAEHLFHSIESNREALTQSFPSIVKVNTLQETKAYICDKDQKFVDGTAFFWGVWLKDDSTSRKLIGQIQLKSIDRNLGSAEFGYWIDPAMQRQGFASEILQSLIEDLMSQNGFRRIYVRIIPENAASIGLVTKLGFQREGLMRAAFKTGKGEISDIVLMALTKERTLN